MQTASSARSTAGVPESAVEETATVAIPSSRAARTTRRAISPRFATSSLTGAAPPEGTSRLDQEQQLTVLHRFAVLRQHLAHDAGLVGEDLVEELHRLDQA